MTTGQWILLVAVVLAVGFGLWRAATDGRFRGTHRVKGVAASPRHTDGAPNGTLRMTPRSVGQDWRRATAAATRSSVAVKATRTWRRPAAP